MIKSGVITSIQLMVELVRVILERDEAIKSVVFCGNGRYEVCHRNSPWFLEVFPERSKVFIYDGSVFIKEV